MPPSDLTFRRLLSQLDVDRFGALLQQWMAVQPGVAETVLRSLAMNALRLDGYWSITEGLTALAHDVKGLLALVGWREPLREQSSA